MLDSVSSEIWIKSHLEPALWIMVCIVTDIVIIVVIGTYNNAYYSSLLR